MRQTRTPALIALVAAVAIAAQPDTPAAARQKTDWFAKAVKRVEAKFEPAEAKPGQTVTFKLTIDLNDGYYTYPTAQAEKAAASFTNQLKFPEPGSVVFVGAITDPPIYDIKSEPDLDIKEYRVNPGTAVYTRKAVVSPKATPGATAVKLTAFRLQVCDKNLCYPPRPVPVEATLKVLDGPAVPVEAAFAAEVAKAVGP
jgi:plastocyanin